MAKTSTVQRNLKRIKLAKKFSKKRDMLKKIIKNKKLPLTERFEAQLKLAKIPRNSANFQKIPRVFLEYQEFQDEWSP